MAFLLETSSRKRGGDRSHLGLGHLAQGLASTLEVIWDKDIKELPVFAKGEGTFMDLPRDEKGQIQFGDLGGERDLRRIQEPQMFSMDARIFQ